MTAILRHGTGANGSVLALPFNPPGGHRQTDNLSLYYCDRGQVILGEQGYVGDSPMNAWVRGTTLSHNLVVVDDANQRLGAKDEERLPKFGFMATSRRVSVVDASSEVYPQCADYRRTVALIKGPGSETVALDIFRVKGGGRHAYRLFSEIAASDCKNGRIEFPDLDMPAEPPLPDYGSSVDPEHIFGLQDVRRVEDPPPSWRADWKQAGRRYRLRMLSQVDAVEASHGPGQESIEQIGRRVRFVDAITVGQDLSSTFIALHEPGGPRGSMPVRRARQLRLPTHAGQNAVAVRLLTKWGIYWIFSDVDAEVQVDGIRFQGSFGVWCEPPDGEAWHFAVGASTLARGEGGFSGIAPSWHGQATDDDGANIKPDSGPPEGWSDPPEGVTAWIAVDTDTYRTGYPLRTTSADRIAVDRFPLETVTGFELPAVRYG
jgi:hypothetical protein